MRTMLILSSSSVRSLYRLILSLPIAMLAASSVEHNAAVTMGDFTGSRVTLLAVDNVALPLRKNLCYYLSKPKVRAEPVLKPNLDDPHATDGTAAMFYGTVLHEGGKFRMWYYGLGMKRPLDGKATDEDWDKNIREGPICYAESPDGLHWVKPHLRQVEYHGSRDNNAIALPEDTTEGAFVIRDDEDPDAGRRYKMVYENHAPGVGFYSIRTATSADGISWTAGPDSPVDEGFEPCSFWKFEGLYVIGAHFAPHGVSEGGNRGGRQGFVWVSPDFKTWLPESGESFILPEPPDPNDRGLDRRYVQVHLGVGGFNYGNALVGIYCQWHAEPTVNDWFGQGRTYGDFGLLVSDDGQHFREPVPGFVYLDRHESTPQISNEVRFSTILAQSGNGILNVGDETWIYHGRWANTELNKDYYGEVALATLPRDRWGALGLFPRSTEGSVWTAPLKLEKNGLQLWLNAQGVQGMTVEIGSTNFGLLPEFSGANAGVVHSKDGLDCAVDWPNAHLDSLVGKKVRFLIQLRQGNQLIPRLYAAYVGIE